MKIVFLEYPETKERNMQREFSYLPEGTNVEIAVYEEGNLEPFHKAIEDADAILTGFAPIDQAAIDCMKQCKIISVQATGWNFIDVEYARAKGIATCAVGEYCTQEVADHAMTLMLALEKQLPYLMKRINVDGVFEIETLKEVEMKQIGKQTLGIVGFGKIGRAVAERAKGFGMRVIAYDPYIPKKMAEDRGVELTDLDTLLAESDVISIHMIMTEENQGFFTKKQFLKMKKKPYLLNLARGAMINEDDLADALDAGLLKGAGLDVLYSESPDLSISRLTNRQNVIITPHSGFYSEDAIEACEKISVQNICYYLDGQPEKVFKLV